MAKQQQTADSLKPNELKRLVTVLLTGEASEDQQKQLQKTLRKVVNLSDVVTVVRAITNEDRMLLNRVLEILNIQKRVIEQLDPTGELRKSAEEEFKKEYAEAKEAGKKHAEEEEKAEDKTEEE